MLSKLTIKELLLLTQNYWDKTSCLDIEKKKGKTQMDEYIKECALQYKKEVIGLENIAETIGYIDTEYLKGIEESEIIASLKYRLDKIAKGAAPGSCEVEKLYATGRYKFDFANDLIYNLIYLRNINWKIKIDKALDTKKSLFIAVGAAHLDYTTGLIALLSARGYIVTPVNLY
jgi:uncharacterized protein YbaP (TraB family)